MENRDISSNAFAMHLMECPKSESDYYNGDDDYFYCYYHYADDDDGYDGYDSDDDGSNDVIIMSFYW